MLRPDVSTVASGPSAAPDAPLDWGAAREMNAIETLMWRLEADPHLRAPVCLMEVLDRAPEWERFLAACDWGTRMAPRLRQKVVEPTLGLGNPCWVTDPEFDLGYHVWRTAMPARGGWSDVLRAVEKLAMTPIDRARSPWESILIEGLEGGRAIHVIKMHHSVTDGLGAVQLLERLYSKHRENNPSKPQPPPPSPENPSSRALLLRQLERDARALPRMIVARGPDLARQLRSPRAAAQRAWDLGASVRRMTAEPDARPSPLLDKRSLSWRFHLLEVRFRDLRAAAKRAGASVNDAFFAAVLGALRRYHEALGCPVDKLPMGMPISVRREGDAEGGNRFVGARLAAPVGIADPEERMQAIAQLVRQLRAEPALEAVAAMAPVLSRIPGPLLGAATSRFMKGNDLQASSVPGIRDEVFIAGARVERTFAFAPLPGCATMFTLITHGETCCVAANVDSAAVTDADVFDDCLDRGFREVMASVPGAAPPIMGGYG